MRKRRAIAGFMAGILVLSAAGCGGGQTPTEAPTTAAPAETTEAAPQEDGAGGTYTGTAKGFGGDITAEVTVDGDGKITGLKVTGDHVPPF